ncbi:MAG: chromosomal replication initiator protein DnaA [Actinomycetota bacterium]|jgi:chromosomal replication initiator protein|nr:chromosomal replication initiator protein DnaA [Actinomycetota bacterium]
MNDASRLWITCTESLKQQLPESTWKAWFEAIEPVELHGNTLVLNAPSQLVKERIQNRFMALIQSSLTTITDDEYSVEISAVPKPQNEIVFSDNYDGDSTYLELPLQDHKKESLGASSKEFAANLFNISEFGTRRVKSRRSESSPLDPRYTFDSFVIGASNRFAHAAALSVAETPSKSYNPLFIHGGAGLGKTHLLHAIGNYARENYPDRHVRYVSTETFLNEFVDAIRNNATQSFKKRYRECDILLVDDVQFIENRESLQEEFFYTFNSLYGASKQIVLTSDRPPKAIATLEDRLRSRFLSGLITDVQPPEIETRLAILKKKAEGSSFAIPDKVFEFIAESVKDNIRELEGALTRVCAFSRLYGTAIDISMAQDVLADIISSQQGSEITVSSILSVTSSTFGFSIDELTGVSRKRPLVIARQVAMYVVRELTDLSYPAIGKAFGNKDHTTVMHSVEKIETLMSHNREVYNQVSEILSRIRGGK